MRRARFSELRAAIEKAAGDPAAVRKLLAEDGAAGDNFGGGPGWGNSVAVGGDTTVIGACGDDDKGEGSGSAYVFVRAANGTWSQQAKLTAEDGTVREFGCSVAVDGDTVVIGAYKDDDRGDLSGSAYVFVRAADGIWSQQAKLTATDGAAYDYFGASVSVNGGTAVIGAFGDDDKGENSGSAYVFVRAANGTWSQQAKLIAEDGAAGAPYGIRSVSVDGDTAVIGAAYDKIGSAYIFVRAADGTWSQQAKLTAADGAAYDSFGLDVSVDGGTAVIGAYRDDDRGEDSGSAYVFVRAADGTWSQQAAV